MFCAGCSWRWSQELHQWNVLLCKEWTEHWLKGRMHVLAVHSLTSSDRSGRLSLQEWSSMEVLHRATSMEQCMGQTSMSNFAGYLCCWLRRTQLKHHYGLGHSSRSNVAVARLIRQSPRSALHTLHLSRSVVDSLYNSSTTNHESGGGY